jgi:hypothetical protein
MAKLPFNLPNYIRIGKASRILLVRRRGLGRARRVRSLPRPNFGPARRVRGALDRVYSGPPSVKETRRVLELARRIVNNIVRDLWPQNRGAKQKLVFKR